MQSEAASRLRGERATTWETLVRTATGDPTMYCMEFVVERGKARCPRCVAVAEYSFIELGPNLLRYEVNCAGCGELYREKLGPTAPKAGVVATVDDWLPAVPEPSVPLRARMDGWVGSARRRAASLSASTTSAWVARRARRQPETVPEPIA
ncbi:hypothetical protein A7U43_02220 [Mycobacterium adipatum]|uniref:Uncharacterized protein n=1 Tax=Mycobacterium adipatum TaxID=1682113 RepID=A0A172UGV6_9MYCO|nr:hypothetical protein [Mycobacterium adipatum]ANE78308.1 hypothetical protein A7U43_02220 [Mycobacterium adipatum]